MATGLFDFLKAINQKRHIIDNGTHDSESYIPFLINRGLSYFIDTVCYANDMNCRPWLDKKMQFDYLYYTVRQKNRFSKWHKKVNTTDLAYIQAHYKISIKKAEEYLDILTKEQLESIKQCFAEEWKP